MVTELKRALQAVHAGAEVVASPYCSTPTTLLRALGERARETPRIRLSTGLLLGELAFVDAVAEGALAMRSWHVSGELRSLASKGTVRYLPIRASGVAGLLSSGVDVALIRVSPPDAAGWCSLGPSASFTKALVAAAALVIAEVDDALTRPLGEDARIHRSSIDIMVASDSATPTYPDAPVSDASERIARTVLDFIPDAASVQLGIGAVPQSVAAQLATGPVSELRMIGMACDSMVELIDSGRLVSGVGVHAAEALGTQAVFSLIDRNPAVRLSSSATIHDPRWLGALPRLISVCSALAVDLSGQVASEAIGGRILAGAGGSADFFDGAGLSDGGLRIVALPAVTASGGSRIIRELGDGTPVTLPRLSVDVVVTEFGAAVLTGLSLAERAEALAGVAAPQHRDELLATT